MKRVLKRLWRATFFVRRPILLKTEGFLRRCLTVQMPAQPDFVHDHLLRELVRLQDEVDRLRGAVEALYEAREGLAVVHADEPARMKAG